MAAPRASTVHPDPEACVGAPRARGPGAKFLFFCTTSGR